MIKLLLGDCLPHLRAMPDSSVDAIVTDPPYELSFMGRGWDSSGIAYDVDMWAQCLRVLKPGGHMVAFGATRTVHRIACAIEDAGFEVRDTLHWCYWSGFPKSLDISKECDRLAGAERTGDERIVAADKWTAGGRAALAAGQSSYPVSDGLPTTEAAKTWAGFGTAVKPAIEPALLLRKPLSESSIARNVLRWGTGALNIDACRFAPGDKAWPGPDDGPPTLNGRSGAGHREWFDTTKQEAGPGHPGGRFPANLIHYPKASRAEREIGCAGLPTKTGAEAVDREEGSAGMGPRSGAGRTAGKLDKWEQFQYCEAWVNEVLNQARPAVMAQSLKPGIADSISLPNGECALSMCWCGSVSTDPFHPDIKSTIETAISSTIDRRTWKRSRRRHTSGCIAAVCGYLMEAGLNRVDTAESLRPSLASIGTCPSRGGRYTDGAAHATSVKSWLTSAAEEVAPAAKGGRGGVVRNFHPT